MYESPRWFSLAAEHWDEAHTAFKKQLLLYGETYRPEAIFPTVPVPHDLTVVSAGSLDAYARGNPFIGFASLT